MVKKRLVGIAFFCTLATSGWAVTTSPTRIVTPTQPKWSELTIPQRIVLAPLSDDWDSFENFRQKKWLSIATRFPGMALEEQRRIQKQMQGWGKLTAEERELARENFKAAKQLPTEKKLKLKRKWEEYANLPPEEKERLKQQAVTKPSSGPTSKLMLPTPASAATAASAPASEPAAPAVTLPVPLSASPVVETMAPAMSPTPPTPVDTAPKP